MTLARDISDTNLARTNAETDVKLNKTVTVAGGKRDVSVRMVGGIGCNSTVIILPACFVTRK